MKNSSLPVAVLALLCLGSCGKQDGAPAAKPGETTPPAAGAPVPSTPTPDPQQPNAQTPPADVQPAADPGATPDPADKPANPADPQAPKTAADYPNLKVETITEGTGDETLQLGMTGKFHYTGTLADGQVFDTSRFDNGGKKVSGDPVTFALKEGALIKGWTLGLPGMKVGETRRLTIPADLAYGATGSGGSVPPNSVLVFDVELVDLVK